MNERHRVICEMFDAGHSQPQIAEAVGLSRIGVGYALRRHGRVRSARRQPERDAEIVRLRGACWPYRSIAEDVGCAVATVRYVVQRDAPGLLTARRELVRLEAMDRRLDRSKARLDRVMEKTERDAALIAARRGGASLSQLAGRFGIDPSVVSRIIKRDAPELSGPAAFEKRATVACSGGNADPITRDLCEFPATADRRG